MQRTRFVPFEVILAAPDHVKVLEALQRIADDIRELADRNYEYLKDDPKHPSRHFKNIGSNRWSVRIGRDFRALALEHEMVFTWVWIGSHEEYDRLNK